VVETQNSIGVKHFFLLRYKNKMNMYAQTNMQVYVYTHKVTTSSALRLRVKKGSLVPLLVAFQ
jgi:hypothetical protein